jgi:hypothetical protein
LASGPLSTSLSLLLVGRGVEGIELCRRVLMGLLVRSAMTSKRITKVYTPSHRAEALEFAARNGSTAVAKKFGTSRFSLPDWRHVDTEKWVRRALLAGQIGDIFAPAQRYPQFDLVFPR